MNKTLFTLLALMTIFTAKAQVKSFDYNFDTKVIYKYTHQQDSTNAESRKNTLTQLTIGDKASHFQAMGKFKSELY